MDSWNKGSFVQAATARERRAELVVKLDDAVNEAVQRLKDRGLTSPYLKNFVVARSNPLRFMKGELPSFDELFSTMTTRVRGLNPEKIRSEDLARTGGVADDEGLD